MGPAKPSHLTRCPSVRSPCPLRAMPGTDARLFPTPEQQPPRAGSWVPTITRAPGAVSKPMSRSRRPGTCLFPSYWNQSGLLYFPAGLSGLVLAGGARWLGLASSGQRAFSPPIVKNRGVESIPPREVETHPSLPIASSITRSPPPLHVSFTYQGRLPWIFIECNIHRLHLFTGLGAESGVYPRAMVRSGCRGG